MNFFNRIGNFFKAVWVALHFSFQEYYENIEKLIKENVELKTLLKSEKRKNDLLEKQNKILEKNNQDLKDGLSSLGLLMEEIMPNLDMDKHKKDRFKIMIEKITG